MIEDTHDTTPTIGDLLASPDVHPSHKEVLQDFTWAHLPERLQAISRLFGELACRMMVLHQGTSRGDTLTVALRQLLEAKDSMVRAGLPRQF